MSGIPYPHTKTFSFSLKQTGTPHLFLIPIYTHVDYVHEGDEELENHEVIDKTIRYYENLGFKNITDQYGYTHTAVMMHENE